MLHGEDGRVHIRGAVAGPDGQNPKKGRQWLPPRIKLLRTNADDWQ
jgi:hypothetical protein